MEKPWKDCDKAKEKLANRGKSVKADTFSADGAEDLFATLPMHDTHVLLSGVLRRHPLFADEALIPDNSYVEELVNVQSHIIIYAFPLPYLSEPGPPFGSALRLEDLNLSTPLLEVLQLCRKSLRPI